MFIFLLFFFFSFSALNTHSYTLLFILEENQAEIFGSNSYLNFVIIQFQYFFFFFPPISCVSDKSSLSNLETVKRCFCERDLMAHIRIRLVWRDLKIQASNNKTLLFVWLRHSYAVI